MKILDHDLEPISGINVTPFVDILLLLLVVFMITAPIITKDIQINLPEEKLQNSASNLRRDFVIVFDSKSRIYLAKKQKTLKQLKGDLQNYQKKGGHQIFIEADKKLKYGEIIHLMAFVQNLGFQNIGLLVKEK